MTSANEPLSEAPGDDDVSSGSDPRYIVPGLSRGLALLQLFTRANPRQTLQELAQGLGVTRSAAYRLVYTLENDGFIRREEHSRRYVLTTKVMAFGFEYLASQSIVELALPHLRHLSELTNASAYLVTADDIYAVYILRVAPSASVVSNLQAGTRRPMHITASGRVLLASFAVPERDDMIRRLARERQGYQSPPAAALAERANMDAARGYVYHASILDPGITSCAAAIRDNFGRCVAAVTVIGPDHLLQGIGGEEKVSQFVRTTAARISSELGSAP
jgi:IclR family pca regulon transcriptional regulator